MEQILRHSRSLRLPVQPEPPCAMINAVSADHHINCSVELDSADLGACQVLSVVDVMNVIVLNQRKDSAKMSDDSGLTAVMDITSANDMRSDFFLCPAFTLCLTDSFTFCLCSILDIFRCPLVFIFRLQIFAE